MLEEVIQVLCKKKIKIKNVGNFQRTALPLPEHDQIRLLQIPFLVRAEPSQIAITVGEIRFLFI